MHDELEQEIGLDTMTKAELKAEARARGLSTTGTKAALLERVEQHDSEADGDDGGERGAAQATDERDQERARHDGADDGDAERPSAASAEEEEGEEPKESEEPEEAEEAEPSPEPDEEAEGEEPEPSAEPDEEAKGEEPEPSADADEEAKGEQAEPSADADEEAKGEQAEPPAAEHGRDGNRRAPALTDVASDAARALHQLTGRKVDAVSGVRGTDDGYVVTIEVLELSRVPSTTDVLATYEVDASRDGAVTGYSRIHRYYRNQTTRE